MIRDQIAQLTCQAISAAQAAGDLARFDIPEVTITRPQRAELGDYSASIALKLASLARKAPMQIAQAIVAHMPSSPEIARAEVAAPGFINFILSPVWLASEVARIERAGESFGNLDLGHGASVQVEHVSANPTGPLHIGSGRNAAIGDTLARILKAAGYQVQREYYINDAGSQISHFGESIYARYAQAAGRDEPFPEDGYKGAYIFELANEILRAEGTRFLEMPRDQAIRELGSIGTDKVLEDIRSTLSTIRVEHDSWFSERTLYESGLFDKVIGILRAKDLLYQADGAIWFAGTKMGLDKDAVLIRSAEKISDPKARPTYLASDVAYVWNKLVDRGFQRAIYVWGAGHHGDVPRVIAAAKALGIDPDRLVILIYQNVLLKRGGETVHMSKRAGEFTTLRELTDEVGADAVRFMLITRSADAPMEFDLQLAKEQSLENPVYYVQYSHARMASILRLAADQGIKSDDADLSLLRHDAEMDLIRAMLRFEEIVELAATKLEPHHLPHYAMELAAASNVFYHECRVISSDPADAELTKARLRLVLATKIVLGRVLSLMGVSAPDSM